MEKLPVVKCIVLLLLSVILSSVFYGLCYKYDNKYTHPGTQPINGILYYDDTSYLIRDWEYYPSEILEPSDFPKTPQKYISIGEYSGFLNDVGDIDLAGKATYRLNVVFSDEVKNYTLNLPDIYSRYKLYINGTEMMNTDKVGNRTIVFTASKSAEIIISVSSDGYLYGGITHPPILSNSHDIGKIQTASIALQAALIATALFMCFMFIYIRISSGYKRGLLLSILCVCFIGYTVVPLIRGLSPQPIQPLSSIYLLCYYAMFLLILLLILSLFRASKKVKIIASSVGGFMCAIAVTISAMPNMNQDNAEIFSLLSDIYKWGLVIVMFISAMWALLKKVDFSAPVLFAVSFFSFALGWDRIKSLYEPIVGGWFAETAGFIVICIFGVTLWIDVARAVKDAISYEEALLGANKQMAILKQHYSLLDEQIDNVRSLHHDFRQHLITIKEYTDSSDLEHLQEFVNAYEKESLTTERIIYTDCEPINILTRYYSSICKINCTDFEAKYNLPKDVGISDIDINIILGNLLENAVNACAAMTEHNDLTKDFEEDSSCNPYVKVLGMYSNEKFVLKITNSFDKSITSKKGTGQGLKSIKTAVTKNGGNMVVTADSSKFEVSVII